CRGVAVEVRLPHPVAGEPRQRLPLARKGQLEVDADYAVVVILNLSFKPFSIRKGYRVERFDYGGTGETDIFRSRALERGSHGARPENPANLLELNLLADVIQDKYQYRSLQSCRSRGRDLGRDGQLLSHEETLVERAGIKQTAN